MVKFLHLLIFMSFGMISAQKLPDHQLPKPGKLSLNYLNSLKEKNILWGAVPPNYNGKVIVFNHGYLGSTELILIGNKMYLNAYNEGFKTAFVATTRGKGDWVNGEALSRALTQVTEHYNIKKVSLVVHSNGGRASEVALFHHNKRDLVNKVITLGTPFRGTQLADITELPWLKWVWDLTGFSDGSALSTTYYCDGYFRPFFDHHKLNQPEKYYNYGAWGGSKGKSVLFAVPMSITEKILKTYGGGINDGVTPFYSSTRPGGTQLYKLNDIEGKMNHVDLIYGQYTWNNIKKVLHTDSKKKAADNFKKENIAPENYTMSSNYQIISSDLGYDKIIVENQTSTLKLELLHEDLEPKFKVKDINKRSLASSIQRFSREEEQGIDKHLTSAEVRVHPGSTEFAIETDSRFVAVVTQEKESPLIYNIQKESGKTLLKVELPSLNTSELQTIQVSGLVQKKSELKGEIVTTEDSEILFFKQTGNYFTLDVTNYPEGIYSLFINAEIENKYRRNLISGFVISNKSDELNDNNISLSQVESDSSITLFPNPVNEKSNLSFGNDIAGEVRITVYNVNGKREVQFILNVNEGNTYSIGQYLSTLSKGLYIMNVDSNSVIKNINFAK